MFCFRYPPRPPGDSYPARPQQAPSAGGRSRAPSQCQLIILLLCIDSYGRVALWRHLNRPLMVVRKKSNVQIFVLLYKIDIWQGQDANRLFV